MATNAAKECPICSENYNEEERCPRSLPCAHSICSACVQNLIDRNKKTCPFCVRQFRANSARDVGLNTALLDVLKLLRDMERKAPFPHEGSREPPSNWRVEFKKESEEIARENISRCRETKEHISITTENNNEICQTLSQVNHVIENEITVNLKEIVTENKKRMRWLVDQNKLLENQNKSTDAAEERMEEGIKKLKTSSEADSLFAVEKMNSGVKTWLEMSEKQLLELKKTHQKIEKVAKSAESKLKSFQEALISHAREEDEITGLIPDIPAMNNQKIIPQQITVETLREKKEPVMELLKQGRVYASLLFEGKYRYANISISRENRICLHRLNEKVAPTNVHLLHHSHVMNLVSPSSSRLSFLELSDANKRILGRMYIRLTPDSKRATQFSILCTGEKGPTYTNTPVTYVQRKGWEQEEVRITNFDLLRGNGRAALVTGAAGEKGVMFCRPCVKGSVTGFLSYDKNDPVAANFSIYTKNIPGRQLDNWFGMVEEGLDVLTGAIASRPGIMEIHFSDSGIVLPI